MRYWLIELPSRVLNLWFTIYWAFVTMTVIAMFLTLTVSMVLLYGFGIRWGW